MWLSRGGSRSCSWRSLVKVQLSEEILEERLWVVDIDIGFGLWHVIIDGGEDSYGSLTGFLDLQESIGVVLGGFTLLAEVVVLVDTALVTNSNYWIGTAAVTNNVVVNLVGVHGLIQVILDALWLAHGGIDLIEVVRYHGLALVQLSDL